MANRMLKRLVFERMNGFSIIDHGDLRPDELAFYLRLPYGEKKRLNRKYLHILNRDRDQMPILFQLISSNLPPLVKAETISKFRAGSRSTGADAKLSDWIRSALRLPLGKYVGVGVDSSSSPESIEEFVKAARSALDESTWGQENVKDEIQRLVASWITSPRPEGRVIGIQGSAGTGKTRIAIQGIARALGVPFVSIPVGGEADGSLLRGTLYPYEGSTYGRIAGGLIRAGCMNPVFFFDELDKVSGSRHGEELISTLIHLTDPEQNGKFQDRYFADVELDLSRCLFVFSMNDSSAINSILLDRMHLIRIADYSTSEKIEIARKFIIPSICDRVGMNPEKIRFSSGAMDSILRRDSSGGLRFIKNMLRIIITEINLRRIVEPSAPTKAFRRYMEGGRSPTIDSELVDEVIACHGDGVPSGMCMYT